MADGKNMKGGMLQPTPYNECPGDDDMPNISGGGLYGSWQEIMAAHLSTDEASLENSPNTMSGAGINGGPAPGEPQLVSVSTTSQSRGGKGKK